MEAIVDRVSGPTADLSAARDLSELRTLMYRTESQYGDLSSSRGVHATNLAMYRSSSNDSTP